MDVQATAEAIALSAVQWTGKPSLLQDPAGLQILLTELINGTHLEPACELAGISPSTVRQWMKRGESDDAQGIRSAYAQAYRAIKHAEAHIESQVTRNIISASKIPAHWAAGATYLERKHAERWGRPEGRNQHASQQMTVHVHGLSRSDVVISLSPAGNAPQSESLPNYSVIDAESDNASYVNYSPKAVSAEKVAPYELAAGDVVTAASGAASQQGSHHPAPPASAPAANNTKSTSYVSNEAAASNLEGASHELEAPQKKKKPTSVAPADWQVSRPWAKNANQARYVSLQAWQRSEDLKAAARRERKKKQQARRLADSARHKANRAAKAQKAGSRPP